MVKKYETSVYRGMTTEPARCLRCGRKFKAAISKPLFNEDGRLLRGPRQVHRQCLNCRRDEDRLAKDRMAYAL